MVMRNAFDQPIGDPLPDWQPRPRPPRSPIAGRLCRLEPMAPERHAQALFEAYRQAPDARAWTYLGVGPFETLAEYQAHCERMAASQDPLHFVVIDQASGRAVGTLALMRIDPANGVVEVGHVTFSPLLQGTALSTEAQFLLMRRVFDELGYRRYEWKCDSLNEPSRRAAGRLGFLFEGIFRQATVYKGRSRDTAWYSLLDGEWPAVKAAFERWLEPGNFDADGRQRERLITRAA
ncbi:acetyltransferase [Bordetella trematum]|uniref:Acetyltransferase n=1 Tax=Bordetella trematum TaxID=123899 RepID=A0A157LZX6_9BORD|nr:GNAT family protein [Bordetella trematum]AUL47051.1 GNAT family N-acetyltransferase [Bordetella trematum]AZR93851.1 acetyltransferase [Bordetella trematum]NNH18977.1 GNAT family N-acetyltransferase [Bordetella trematum]QIM72434.1 N-acetyltransferase [Bordetella trematum]SAI02365.1 acetyltransferase [Bordetella trematum]